MKTSLILNENIKFIEEKFKDCNDVVKRKIPLGRKEKVNIYIVYIDLLTNVDMIDEAIVRMMMTYPEIISDESGHLKKNIFEIIKNNGITKVDVIETDNCNDILQGILSGDTALFIEGYKEVLMISTKSFPNRGVPKTESEVVVQGSKEAFSEVFRFNTALIRRRIRDTNLKIKQMIIGRRSKTNVAIIFLEDVVRKEILKDLESRLKNIDIDAIFDIGYIEQLIEDDFMSPFPQTQITERPDKAAASILEGRIAVIVDNSPYALIVPTTFNSFFQSSEDYYQRFEIMSILRVLRYFAAILSVCLPGLYIALTDYHPSMIPMQLVFKMAETGRNVPFPTVVEVMLLDILYELLKEAGIRLPGPVGSTMGIVGGLIIGQTAVEAGFVSPFVVIVIALTAISNFAIPNYSFVTGFRITKYLLILLSAILGLFGFWIGAFLILSHLVSLKSFGIPYMFPYTSGEINNFNDFKDTIIRFPVFKMKNRPIFANPKESIRLVTKKQGNKREEE